MEIKIATVLGVRVIMSSYDGEDWSVVSVGDFLTRVQGVKSDIINGATDSDTATPVLDIAEALVDMLQVTDVLDNAHHTVAETI